MKFKLESYELFNEGVENLEYRLVDIHCPNLTVEELYKKTKELQKLCDEKRYPVHVYPRDDFGEGKFMIDVEVHVENYRDNKHIEEAITFIEDFGDKID